MIAGKVQFEALAWAAVAVVAWAASAHFNVADTISEQMRSYEGWQLDELVVLIVFLSLAAFVVSC